MTTVELYSLLSDADCPWQVLFDAIGEFGVDLTCGKGFDSQPQYVWRKKTEDVHTFYLLSDESESEEERLARSFQLLDAVEWAENEGNVSFQWEERMRMPRADKALYSLTMDHCNAEGEEVGDFWIPDHQSDEWMRYIEAQTALELRPKIPPLHRFDGMSAQAIADEYGLHYNGDVNPILYGGTWYSLRDWDNWGFASFVEVQDWPDSEDEDEVLVSIGTVNKLDADRLAECFKAEETPRKYRKCPHTQFDAIKSYWGAEYDNEKRFVINTRNGLNAMWAMIEEALEDIRNK